MVASNARERNDLAGASLRLQPGVKYRSDGASPSRRSHLHYRVWCLGGAGTAAKICTCARRSAPYTPTLPRAQPRRKRALTHSRVYACIHTCIHAQPCISIHGVCWGYSPPPPLPASSGLQHRSLRAPTHTHTQPHHGVRSTATHSHTHTRTAWPHTACYRRRQCHHCRQRRRHHRRRHRRPCACLPRTAGAIACRGGCWSPASIGGRRYWHRHRPRCWGWR